MRVDRREQRRQAIAHDLASAAFGLTVERGLDGFTIDELTDRAGYARRTFANYYSCKEEAVVALALEALREGLQSVPDLPEAAQPLDWLRGLATHQLSRGLLGTLLKLNTLAQENPGLEAYLSRVFVQIRNEVQEAVQHRFNGDLAVERVSIMVGAAYGALTALLEQFAPFVQEMGTEPDPAVLGLILDEVFDQLQAGL